MQIQHKTKPVNIIVMITMVICIVFASSFKAALDATNFAKKITTQQLLEEEPNEKEVKVVKEVYQKYNSHQDLYDENYTGISLKTVYLFLLKRTSPYLKVHTPPPDHSFLV